MKKFTIILILFSALQLTHATPVYKTFDKKTMEYKGTKAEQAKILLENPQENNDINHKSVGIPIQFEKLLTSEFKISKDKTNAYLKNNDINPNMIGGSITSPISYAKSLFSKNRTYAKYFVIHDTSTPELPEFPENINDKSWKYNDVNFLKWTPDKRPAHIILTRTGDSKTLIDFAEGWRATKFENDILGRSSKGLFIHVEMVQPRTKSNGATYYDQAPKPGFTDAQYEKLALLYVCASVRKGDWLIPAFHRNIDEGISENSHDDPQNFEIKKFTDAVTALTNQLE